METLDLLMQWVVAPVAAFVWVLHNRVNRHSTDIEVIKATSSANKEAHRSEERRVGKECRTRALP